MSAGGRRLEFGGGIFREGGGMLAGVRVFAGGAFVAVVGAAVLVGVAEALSGVRWDRYLSELADGSSGALYSGAVVLAAVGAFALAGAFVLIGRGWWVPAAPLVLAGLALVGSAAVPCTSGCPLPVADGLVPAQDAIHAFVSNFALVALVIAAALTAELVPVRAIRGASLAASVGLAIAIVSLSGWAILVRSHDPVPVVAEWVAVAVAGAWTALLAGWLAIRPAVRNER
jgi:hypothetical protein